MSARVYAALALLVAVAAFVVAATVGAAAVMTNESLRVRKLEQRIAAGVQAADRYVDIGVVIRIVAGDPNGEELVEGAPSMRVLREYTFGGLLDTRATPPKIVDPVTARRQRGVEPRIWHCSEQQWQIVRHSDDEPIGKLALGGMGAGKTTAGVMWLYLRWLETIDFGETQRRQFGVTAPTETRMLLVLDEIKKLWPESWFSFSTATNILTLCDLNTIRFVSTKRQSEAQGSRIAGFNWSAWLGDELQDQFDEYTNIIARLRSARNGRGKRLGTATAKDDPAWRTFKQEREASGDWRMHQMLGPDSPFIYAEHWRSMARSMSVNEYRRFVLAEDLPSSLAVYYEWLRDRNLVLRPQIAKDVTAAVLRQYQSYTRPGTAFGLGLGHDPGVIYNTTEIAKLVLFSGVPTWMVVGEFQTKQTTQRQHARQLKQYLRDEFYVDHPTVGGPWPIVFCDPHGKGEAQTDYQSVYMAFQGEGLDVFNPAPMTARIKRSARIEMMNRLMAGVARTTADVRSVTSDPPRLVVAHVAGRPVAPKLVEAFESLKKRPGDDNPEGTQKKDEDDKTHAPAALAYLLWPFEQEAITATTVATALRAR